MAPLSYDVLHPSAKFCDATFGVDLWSAMAALLPVLAYPFLPSGPVCSCGSILTWSSAFNLLFFHFPNVLHWANRDPYVQIPFWVFPLALFSFIVGFGRLSPRCKGNDPRPNDAIFVNGAKMAFCIVMYHLFKLGGFLFDKEQPTSPHNYRLTVLWGLFIVVAGRLIFKPFTESVRAMFYQLAMRRVRWWFWLPENDADNNFRPVWSVILALMVNTSSGFLVHWQVVSLEAVLSAGEV